MIITITLNPCIDKSTITTVMEPEKKLRCSEVLNEPGGGGINVSKALQKLQTASVAMFPSGGNNGNMLCSLLKQQNLTFYEVDTNVETRENWIVVDDADNKQYRFTFLGRAVEDKAIIELIDALNQFAPTFIIASGSLPPGLPANFYGLIVKKANAIGAKCIVDTSGEALQALQGKGAYLIKPNIGELCKMLGVDDLQKNEVDDAALQAIQDGYAEIVAVSMGAQGAWLVSKTEKYFAPAPKVEMKSTVGAGDSMVAGIIFMLQQQKSIKEVIQFGVACGSAATMNSGTQLFKVEDVHALYAAMQ